MTVRIFRKVLFNLMIRTPNLHHYPLRLDMQTTKHPRQDLRYHSLPVNRRNNNLQIFAITHNREVTRLFHNSTELKLEVTVKNHWIKSSSDSNVNSN